MSRELDMIPGRYRERLKIKRWCQQFLLVFGLLIISMVLLHLSLARETQRVQANIRHLQKDKSFNLQQQKKYNALFDTETRFLKNLELLSGLRGGPSARQILLAIDRVVNERVWFIKWSFRRAGEVAEFKPQTVETGYFIVIPRNTAGNDKQKTWKLDTHMQINGQALDHSSLSRFVTNLIKQPEVDDVQVINTGLRRHMDTQIVDFNLVVIINNRFKVNDL